jgi:hypothetical protein
MKCIVQLAAFLPLGDPSVAADAYKRGLRLPEKPLNFWYRSAQDTCGLVLHPTEPRAMYCYFDVLGDGWALSRGLGVLSNRYRSGLAHGDKYVVLMENSDRTPFRTVYEIALGVWLSPGEVAAQYPELADEVQARGYPEGVELLQVTLRVPMEVLQ